MWHNSTVLGSEPLQIDGFKIYSVKRGGLCKTLLGEYQSHHYQRIFPIVYQYDLIMSGSAWPSHDLSSLWSKGCYEKSSSAAILCASMLDTILLWPLARNVPHVFVSSLPTSVIQSHVNKSLVRFNDNRLEVSRPPLIRVVECHPGPCNSVVQHPHNTTSFVHKRHRKCSRDIFSLTLCQVGLFSKSAS